MITQVSFRFVGYSCVCNTESSFEPFPAITMLIDDFFILPSKSTLLANLRWNTVPILKQPSACAQEK